MLFCPIAFARKRLSRMEVVVQQHLMGSPWHTTWSQEVSPLLFFQGHLHADGPQTIGGNNQKRCSKAIPVVTVHYAAIHQYSVHILHKPGHDFYIVDWLSRNNLAENKDQENTSMNVNRHVIITSVNILVCTSIGDIWSATSQDAHLQKLKLYITQGWPQTKDKV